MCKCVCDVVAWVAEVLGQTLNGLGAAHKGLHAEANKGNLQGKGSRQFSWFSLLQLGVNTEHNRLLSVQGRPGTPTH